MDTKSAGSTWNDEAIDKYVDRITEKLESGMCQKCGNTDFPHKKSWIVPTEHQKYLPRLLDLVALYWSAMQAEDAVVMSACNVDLMSEYGISIKPENFPLDASGKANVPSQCAKRTPTI